MDMDNQLIQQPVPVMEEKTRPEKYVKLWQSIVMLVVIALIIFVFEGFAYYFLGFYGTALGEVLMAVTAVLTVVLAGARLKPVFQFRKPEWKKTAGTIMLWLGSYLITIMITSVVEYFFPAEMADASAGLTEGIMSVEMIPALLIVSLSPAICEELVFRGTFFNAVWNKTHKKWFTIIVVGVVFGAFHGSVWRFVPTCILGIFMGYILFETNNMFYNMLYHGINNGVPILLMFLSGVSSETYAEYDAMIQDPELYRMEMLPALGVYMILAGLGVILIYQGIKRIRFYNPYMNLEEMMEKKRKERLILFAITGCLLIMGVVVMFFGTLLSEGAIREIMDSVAFLI